MSGPRVVILPHVHPDRWARREIEMRVRANVEWSRHGATGLWAECRAKAEACGRWARDLRHLHQVVAEVNAELARHEQGGGRA